MTNYSKTWSTYQKERRDAEREEWFQNLNGAIAIVLMIAIVCVVLA